MKIVNCEMHKVALAALLLGLFSLNPLAKAEEENLPLAQRDGLKWGELRSLSGNTFNIRIDGDMLVFTGGIPKGCALGRSMSEVDSSEGRHALSINLPNCPQGDTSKLSPEDKKMVQVKAAFPAKAFNSNVDGKLCLLYSTNGDGEEGCDEVMINGKPLEHISGTTRAKAAAEEQARKNRLDVEAQAVRAREDQNRKEKALIDKLNLMCKQGDFAGFGAEIDAARSFLGDVTKVMDQLDSVKKKFYEDAIKKAKAEDDIKTAYDNYLQAASENGWETDEVTTAYVGRRVDIMKEVVNGSDSAETKATAVRSLTNDLRELDLYRANKANIAWAYAQIASNLKDSDKLDEAEVYFGRAMEHVASQEDKVKLETEMAKMFREAAEACLEKNKLAPGKCDRLAQKSEKHMSGAIAAEGKIKGEDAAAALQGMQVEKIQMFGMSGYSMQVNGYGNLNMAGGAYDMKKRQFYQQGQQELYTQYMMRTQMGTMGMGVQGGTAGTSFFR